MRLIDADDFKKFMQALCKAGSPYESFIELLDKQNTAYDIEKVVEELEMEMKASSGYSAERVSAFSRAIEIVKQGGVSDDFCEWTQSGDMAISPHTFSKYKIKQCDGLYALSTCPYCGKKIKVVE